MKRALLALVAGAILSGLAAAYAASAERSRKKGELSLRTTLV